MRMGNVRQFICTRVRHVAPLTLNIERSSCFYDIVRLGIKRLKVLVVNVTYIRGEKAPTSSNQLQHRLNTSQPIRAQ